MSKFHVYHISFFDSLFKGLESSGVALSRYANQGHIRRFNLEAAKTYLPLEISYELLDKIKFSQGIDCISSEFYGGFLIEDLSDYGEYLATCPDLYSLLLNAIKYDYLIQTHGKLSLKTIGAISWFSMKHMDPLSNGRQISERINLAMMIKAFHYILGPDWTPIEVNITTDDGYWLKNHFTSLDFKLNTNCPDIGVCFKTSQLASKNKYFQETSDLEHLNLQSIEETSKIIFRSLRGNYLPTIDEFAEYFGYSKRTMIRKFRCSDISYKSLLDKYLFLKAIELLNKPSLTIEEISFDLGYSHPSNFIRAFKRWTSTTPYRFRHQATLF